MKFLKILRSINDAIAEGSLLEIVVHIVPSALIFSTVFCVKLSVLNKLLTFLSHSTVKHHKAFYSQSIRILPPGFLLEQQIAMSIWESQLLRGLQSTESNLILALKNKAKFPLKYWIESFFIYRLSNRRFEFMHDVFIRSMDNKTVFPIIS